jgi:hypothetical protein
MKSIVSQTTGIVSTVVQNLNNIIALNAPVNESITVVPQYTIRNYEVKPITTNLNNINLDLDGGTF